MKFYTVGYFLDKKMRSLKIEGKEAENINKYFRFEWMNRIEKYKVVN